MDITKKLTELDGIFTLHNEGDWDKPYDPEKPGSFSSYNDAGIETETGEFLYAMTRILKPDNVLETGTHFGVGAAYMGSALKANRKGHMDTIEFLPEIHKTAAERIRRLGLEDFVTGHFGDVASFTTDKKYKLILLDTEPQTRFAELVKFFDNLEEGGFVFIHDLHQHMHQIENTEHGFAWPFGKIPSQITSWVNEDKLRPFHFETPRGLTGFYKPHANDHKWS